VSNGNSGTAGCLNISLPNRPDSGLVDNSNTTLMNPLSESKEEAKMVDARDGM